MATSYESEKKLEQVISAETKPAAPPSADVLAALKTMSFFEQRLADGKDTLVDKTAEAELLNIRRGMYLLQNNEQLKSVLGEGLQASLVAAKIADQHTREKLFRRNLDLTMETKAASDAQLGLTLEENLDRLGVKADFISNLQRRLQGNAAGQLSI